MKTMKSNRYLFLILLLLLSTFGGEIVLAQSPVDEVASIEITQVDNSAYPQVVVYVRVLDATGVRVEGLAREYFRVNEDSKGVEIVAFSGVNYETIYTVLLMDKSSSMEVEGKLESAQSAAQTFIELMRGQDQAAVIAFDDEVYLIQDFTSDREKLKTQIRSLIPGECTAWYDGIHYTAEIVAPIAGRKSVILLSDGIDCRESAELRSEGRGSAHSFDDALFRMQSVETPVYAIALGRQPAQKFGSDGYDKERLLYVASKTGGDFFHSPTGDQLADLYESLSQATQNEYVITYHSPRPTYDGTRRDIVVTVGGLSGGGEYLEVHLLNIVSDTLVGLLLLLPLLLAWIVPASTQTWMRWKSQLKPAVPTPPQPVISPPAVVQPSQTVQCVHCGQPLRSGARFCASCGGSQDSTVVVDTPSASFCRHCGSALRFGGKFCAKCGRQI